MKGEMTVARKDYSKHEDIILIEHKNYKNLRTFRNKYTVQVEGKNYLIEDLKYINHSCDPNCVGYVK